jgi:UDP-glucose 4-epimerase
MKVLITGGAGFIGSQLTQLLLDDGDEVFVLDDLSTGSLDNVVQFEGDSGYQLVVECVLHRRFVNELVNKVNIVYHLAALSVK